MIKFLIFVVILSLIFQGTVLISLTFRIQDLENNKIKNDENYTYYVMENEQNEQGTTETTYKEDS